MSDSETLDGNAAAMREALERVLHHAAFIHGDVTILTAGQSLVEEVRAALSAPPRNCDRFNSGEEAWIAFERKRPNWCDEHSSKDPDCTDCEMADCGRCMAEWLMAPAKEGK